MEEYLNNGEREQAAPFRYDFSLEGKSLETEQGEDGNLYVEGYAADFETDRQSESFTEGAFERGLKSYMDRNPILCYHHKFDQALGQVVEANLDSKGMKIKARLDKPASGSWAEDIYNKVKSGTIRSFSVGGIFRRKLTEKGWRIHDVDLAEISVTPVPVNPRTTFSVVAGKAFSDVDETTEEVDYASLEAALERFDSTLSQLEAR